MARITVIATERGYYGGKVRSIGEKFAIETAADMGSWMEKVVVPRGRPPTNPTAQPTTKE